MRISDWSSDVCSSDLIGLAGWIAKKQEVKLWMTRGEMLTARAIVADSSDTAPDEVLAQSRAAGWDEAAIEAQRTRGWNMFQRMIFTLPRSYVRIAEIGRASCRERVCQ